MKDSKGFTLIELLVVISIIALLLSILMPSLSKVKENARRSVCLSNSRQWAIACHAYATDQDDRFPAKLASNGKVQYAWPWVYYKVRSSGFVYINLVDSFLASYIHDPKFFFCPSVRSDSPKRYIRGKSIEHMNWNQMKWAG